MPALDRREALKYAAGWALLAGLWRPSAASAEPEGLGSEAGHDRLTIDVACLGQTFSPDLSGARDAAGGDLRGGTFLVEGNLYRRGTIPDGDGFDPASVPALGHWICRGWLMISPERPLPDVITTQEYFFQRFEETLSPPDTLVSSGIEGASPGTTRAVIGGTGRYRTRGRGEVVQRVIGTNTTVLNVLNVPAPNFRFVFRFV